MSISIDQFVKFLTDSGIISPSGVVKLRDRIATNDGLRQAEMLAEALIKENVLTKYQATILLQGEPNSLILGNYTILDKLGAGGMGHVYRAWHRRMKRLVALKTLPRETMSDERVVQRFRREVETAAKLNHRNIVTAHDADEVDGIHFLIMECVQGEDLSTVIRRDGPCSLIDGVNFVLDAARGLEFAHQEGVIHRDIKPSNLLLDNKRMVKVLDLGLARMSQPADSEIESQEQLTSSWQVFGTVDYMAPEQAVDFKRADHRVDIYGLGICLYYLLTGKVPFPGSSAVERIIAHRENPAPRLGGARPDIPASLERLFQKMVAKLPQDRHQSMGDVVIELENCLREIQQSAIRESSHRNENQIASSEKAAASPSQMTDGVDSNLAVTVPLSESPPRSNVGLLRWLGLLFGLLAISGAVWFLRGQNGANGPAGTSQEVSTADARTDGMSAIPPHKTFEQRYPDAPAIAIAPFDSHDAGRFREAWAEYLGIPKTVTNSTGMSLQLIPPGEYEMGSSPDEIGKLVQEASAAGMAQWYLDLIPSESPQHRVSIDRALFFGTYEVTQKEYEHVMGGKTADSASPASVERPDSIGNLPAGFVNWFDAIQFCNRLSNDEHRRPCYKIAGKVVTRIEGDGYRLPTEEEWEYACRAGTVTRWYFGDDPMGLTVTAAFKEKGDASPLPVGSKAPNPWNLHDLYGNVWEWCEDVFRGAYDAKVPEAAPNSKPNELLRVVRGGSFLWSAPINRSANRTYYVPDYQSRQHGFRIVREIREISKPRVEDEEARRGSPRSRVD